MSSLWLIVLLPALGAALLGVVGIRAFGRAVSAVVACGTMTAAFLLSVLELVRLIAVPAGARVEEAVLATWLPSLPLQSTAGIAPFRVDWALRLDPLSSVMILVVTGVGLLIHVYATAYMRDEPRGSYARFFCYMNLFCACMLLLVLAANFVVLFVGWEGVGLCSYLLIGYWYERKPAADAGRKAFIVNRIGDWGFLLGILLVAYTFGTVDFAAVSRAASAMPIESGQFGTVSTICLLLFVGAAGKSAQIPLHVWLPDAMEGPTPVSALIHAATMVTAGVYLIARNAVLFSHAPEVMFVVAIVGTLTALMAALIGLVQHDIKRVLAYSTVSQLGYMFLAAGVGAFGAGIFHLVTHALFKALLFLGAGSVIHASGGEQDMRRMGGLRALLPITFAAMLAGTLAIAGVPPLSGFFSKDEILYRAFLRSPALWALALAAAGLTAFYMFRLMALTFEGASRGSADAHPHQPSRAMTIPLIVLAVGAVAAGVAGIPEVLGGGQTLVRFLEPSFTAPSSAAGQGGPGADVVAHGSAAVELGLMLLSIAVAIAGILMARRFYVARPEIPARLAERWPTAHRILLHKLYVDEAYDATIVRGATGAARAFWTFDRRVVDGAVDGSGWLTRIAAWLSHMIDKYIVDGLVNLVGWLAGGSSYALRRLQTGLVQNYALMMLTGVFLFLTVYLLAR